MRLAVYDTGLNYLVAELDGEAPSRGLLVDKMGSLDEDAKAFSGAEPRLGAVRLGMRATAALAARSAYMATFEDGALESCSGDAIDDWEWESYAGV